MKKKSKKSDEPININFTKEDYIKQVQGEQEYVDQVLNQMDKMGLGTMIDTAGIRKINDEKKARFTEIKTKVQDKKPEPEDDPDYLDILAE